jgi:serine/threonine protein kinase
VHRDFKPENVLVGADGRVLVTDFGLATTTAEEDEESPTAPIPLIRSEHSFAGRLTETGMLQGTPAYMAPEQFLGRATDARTDQFSFCVALFESLYGARPFAGEGLEELARVVTEGRIRQVAAARPLPGTTESAVRRGLATDPQGRYASLDELLEALTVKAPPARRRRARARGPFVVVAAAGLLGIGILLARSSPEHRTPARAASAARASVPAETSPQPPPTPPAEPTRAVTNDAARSRPKAVRTRRVASRPERSQPKSTITSQPTKDSLPSDLWEPAFMKKPR